MKIFGALLLGLAMVATIGCNDAKKNDAATKAAQDAKAAMEDASKAAKDAAAEVKGAAEDAAAAVKDAAGDAKAAAEDAAAKAKDAVKLP